jgi:hypothetical protein
MQRVFGGARLSGRSFVSVCVPGEGACQLGPAYHVVLAVKTLRAGLRPVLGESSALRFDES